MPQDNVKFIIDLQIELHYSLARFLKNYWQHFTELDLSKIEEGFLTKFKHWDISLHLYFRKFWRLRKHNLRKGRFTFYFSLTSKWIYYRSCLKTATRFNRSWNNQRLWAKLWDREIISNFKHHLPRFCDRWFYYSVVQVHLQILT
jgi:hypothetical protein